MDTILYQHFYHYELKEIYDGWDNEGLLDGWLGYETEELRNVLKKIGCNTDSIQIMQDAFSALERLVIGGNSND